MALMSVKRGGEEYQKQNTQAPDSTVWLPFCFLWYTHARQSCLLLSMTSLSLSVGLPPLPFPSSFLHIERWVI